MKRSTAKNSGNRPGGETPADGAHREPATDRASAPSSDLGLGALLARIEAEEARKAAASAPLLPWRWTRRALLFAAALLVGQSLMIGLLLRARRDEPAPAAQAPAGLLLEVKFKPTATARQIRALLDGVHGEIVGGPSPAGAYTVRLAPATAQAALARIADSRDLVESASVLRP
jgi:hypothetical protein